MSKPIQIRDLFWTPSDFPEGSVRTELHISGSTETAEYLNNIINDVESPFESYEDEEGLVLIYTSVETSLKVFDMLYEILSVLHSELLGKTDGLYIDDNTLFFKDCVVWID